MGWLWTSPTPPKPSAMAPEQTTASSSSPPPPSSPPTPSTQSAPNESVDAEIQKFYDLFKSEPPSPPSNPPSSSDSASSSSSSSSTPSKISSWLSSKLSSPTDEPLPVPRLSPIAESLLPTDISCRQAFDLAWSCNSLGGQWNAVYRHGTMRSCSPLWDDFWFCMRAKGYSGPLRDRAVRDHYRRKEYEKYYAPGMPSSEQVWEARAEKVEPGTAFAEAIELPAVNDDEWRRMEEERRRKIREGLGFDKGSS